MPEITSITLYDQDLKNIQEKLKNKTIIPKEGKNDLEVVFSHYNVYLVYDVYQNEESSCLLFEITSGIEFFITFDDFETKGSDGISCDDKFNKQAYKSFKYFLEGKIN